MAERIVGGDEAALGVVFIAHLQFASGARHEEYGADQVFVVRDFEGALLQILREPKGTVGAVIINANAVARQVFDGVERHALVVLSP